MNRGCLEATLFIHAGYGHISPVTVGGRIFTMVITIFGLPLMVLSVGSLGKLTTHLSLMFFSIFGTVNRDEKRLKGAIARMVHASSATGSRAQEQREEADATGRPLPASTTSKTKSKSKSKSKSTFTSTPKSTSEPNARGAADEAQEEAASAAAATRGRRSSIWQQAKDGRSSPLVSKHAAMGDTEEFKGEGGMWQYFGVLCVVFILFLVALALIFCPIGVYSYYYYLPVTSASFYGNILF